MRYEFRVCGSVPENAAETFAVVDEAHQCGLLARFRMLGLRVTEMRQLPP
ncbi:hypothetical protein AB0O75_48040 [Streptomyces sp. NPDC088921]